MNKSTVKSTLERLKHVRSMAALTSTGETIMHHSYVGEIVEVMCGLQKQIAELECSESQLIAERDSAEAALRDMYKAVMNYSPEWSNMFQFSDAIEAVESKVLKQRSGNNSCKLPEGWTLIPIEPTSEMLNAVLAMHVGYKSHGVQRGLLYGEAGNIWARMLAAAPAQPIIPWASVSDSLPEKEDGCLMLPCLVRYVWTDGDGNKHYALGEDFFDNDASELGGEWLENNGAVTHWVYMQDLPMPSANDSEKKL